MEKLPPSLYMHRSISNPTFPGSLAFIVSTVSFLIPLALSTSLETEMEETHRRTTSDIPATEESEDALSFCDLPLLSLNLEDAPSPPSDPDASFEFRNSPHPYPSSSQRIGAFCDGIVFCGRIIQYREPGDSRGSAPSELCSPPSPSPGPRRPESTARRPSSSWSRNRLFVCGSEKFPPDMTIDDLRKRHRGQCGVPAPAEEHGGDAAAVEWARRRWRAHFGWLRYRSHVIKAFAGALMLRATPA